MVQGCMFPIFGILITQMLFTLMLPDKQELRDESDEYVLYMFIVAVVSFCNGFIQKFSFGVVGENITLKMR